MKVRPLKWYQKLLTSKSRKKEKRYLIEGIRQVEQVLNSSPESVEEILLLETEQIDSGEIFQRIISPSQMKSITDSETIPLVIAVGIIPDSFTSSELPENIPSKILFLEDVQDPGNVGTLLRSASAFAFPLVLLTENCADPYAPKVVRSTAGSVGGVTIRRGAFAFDLLVELKKQGYQVVTADINGGVSSLSSMEKVIFTLGNEGNGVSEKLLSFTDTVYTIPFDSSQVESLNVAIAGSIGMASSYLKKV